MCLAASQGWFFSVSAQGCQLHEMEIMEAEHGSCHRSLFCVEECCFMEGRRIGQPSSVSEVASVMPSLAFQSGPELVGRTNSDARSCRIEDDSRSTRDW